VALQKAYEWQQETFRTMKDAKKSARRNYEIDPSMIPKIKAQKGIQMDKHNGKLIVFMQRENVSVRKKFSYKDLGVEQALKLACEHREMLQNQSLTEFRKFAESKKRKRMHTS